ncbi:MAG: hypothetical protein JRH20_02670 [Deltaproteobacteria bacterium]|nr:hypothetical protein [Deltaproteobacteria bacterium]
MARWQGANGAKGAGRTIGLGLVLFVLLCGGALVLTAREPTTSPRVKATARVQQALGAVRQANRAIETTDYGKARQHLARARVALEVLAATIE